MPVIFFLIGEQDYLQIQTYCFLTVGSGDRRVPLPLLSPTPSLPYADFPVSLTPTSVKVCLLTPLGPSGCRRVSPDLSSSLWL